MYLYLNLADYCRALLLKIQHKGKVLQYTVLIRMYRYNMVEELQQYYIDTMYCII